jgi:hypothetical protein
MMINRDGDRQDRARLAHPSHERHLLRRRDLDRRLGMDERVGLLLERLADRMAVVLWLVSHWSPLLPWARRGRSPSSIGSSWQLASKRARRSWRVPARSPPLPETPASLPEFPGRRDDVVGDAYLHDGVRIRGGDARQPVLAGEERGLLVGRAADDSGVVGLDPVDESAIDSSSCRSCGRSRAGGRTDAGRRRGRPAREPLRSSRRRTGPAARLPAGRRRSGRRRPT